MTVMVVDDEPSVRRLFESTLQKMGLDVICETSGFNALAQIHERPFDLIFMDLVMPGINGVYAIEEIQKVRPGSRIIVITGHASEDIIGKALAAGAERCLRKPIRAAQIRELALKLRREIDGH